MKNGIFTKSEEEYLLTLDAVEDVCEGKIYYSADFKLDAMKRYHSGERPSEIFASAGLPSSLVGKKRIERAFARWREAEAKGALSLQKQPQTRRQRAEIRRICELERQLKRQKERSKRREEEIIARQAAEIASLKAQVKALKANGALARKTKRAAFETSKSERFQTIHNLREKDPNFNVSAACKALEVSRSGYYEWEAATALREAREEADLIAKHQVETAFMSHGFKKGTRGVRDSLLRDQGIVMNRKKIQRIERKYGICFNPKRKRPYHRISIDGEPVVAKNELDRNFHTGQLRKVILTDITYIPCEQGFCYLSAALDAQSNEILSYAVSTSLEMPFVEKTFQQLAHERFAADALIHSDQGSHYTSRKFRELVKTLGVKQSMSKRACCWDNACMESWFGRMKEQLGDTKEMTYEEVRARIDDYIDYYNWHRGQKRLGWKTPKEYAESLINE